MDRGPLHYLRNLLIGADETGNAVLAGDPHHTISARTGYALVRGKRWAKVCAPIIEAVFGEGHCIRSAIAEGLLPPT
jgi:hypothetical protein